MRAYKLFKIRKDGSLGSLFINPKFAIPINVWLEAELHETKGYKIRKGWHATKYPHAPHLSLKNRQWFEIEIKEYETIIRPNSQGGIWFISNWMKVIKPLNGENN